MCLVFLWSERRPCPLSVQGLRFAPVGANPTSTGRCAPYHPRENSLAFKVFMIRKGLIMKNDDRSDLIFDDLYEPDISEMNLTDEEMEEIRKEHERLGIED